MLYPLKFKAIYKERIWGGDELQNNYNRKLPKHIEPIGESWEISGVKGDESVVANGSLKGNTLSELVEIYMDEMVGESIYQRFSTEFPLLIKLIDAADNLSIQVHPDDELSASRHGAYGKTEMWYVLDAKPGATLYMGFNEEVDKAKYMEYLKAGKLEELLAKYEVKAGDTFFIPAGTIHAIGAGTVIAEIQQTSDVTYRVYDFGRVDSQGKTRELHTELALDAIDYDLRDDLVVTKEPKQNDTVQIQSCPYFASELVSVDGNLSVNYLSRDSFTIYICLEGEVKINTDQGEETLVRGESVLLPAIIGEVSLSGTAKILSTWIPAQ